jgi:hypothetical protein
MMPPRGSFTIPIAKTLPLEQIREARLEAEQGHVHGKIVLRAAAEAAVSLLGASRRLLADLHRITRNE